MSAPVTPPLSSPTACSVQRIMADWDDPNNQPSWPLIPGGAQYAFLPSSTPASPGRRIVPEPGWLAGLQIPSGSSPSSPTFSLVSANPFGFSKGGMASEGSSRMWTPGQSGMCSPAMPGQPSRGEDVHMMDASDEFAFGSSSNGDNLPAEGLVKPWEGERIHEECSSTTSRRFLQIRHPLSLVVHQKDSPTPSKRHLLQGSGNATIAGVVLYIKREFNLESKPTIEGLIVACP